MTQVTKENTMHLTAKQRARIQKDHKMILEFLQEAYERMKAPFDGPEEKFPSEPEYTVTGAVQFLIQHGKWLTHSEVMQIIPCLAAINGIMEGKEDKNSEEAIIALYWVKKTSEIMEVLSYV